MNLHENASQVYLFSIMSSIYISLDSLRGVDDYNSPLRSLACLHARKSLHNNNKIMFATRRNGFFTECFPKIVQVLKFGYGNIHVK